MDAWGASGGDDWVRGLGGEECLHIGVGSDREWEFMSVDAPSVGLVDCDVNDSLGFVR